MPPRGFSMIGLLISLACMVVLASLLLSSLSKVAPQARGSTAQHLKDALVLRSIHDTMVAMARDIDGWYPTPSFYTDARADDTSAAFWSVMVIHGRVQPKMLIAATEQSGYVDEKYEYDYEAYQPADGVFWDETFAADLHALSNVSFAHMVLFGERFERKWRTTHDGSVAVIGSRGPKDGVPSTASIACREDGTWRGSVAFGDGRVETFETTTPAGAWYASGGTRIQDGLFTFDDGVGGVDVLLGFTKAIWEDGPELIWD